MILVAESDKYQDPKRNLNASSKMKKFLNRKGLFQRQLIAFILNWKSA